MDDLTIQLRRAILDSPHSLYRICKETGLGVQVLMRFKNGKTITLITASKVAKYLELELTPKARAKPKRKPKAKPKSKTKRRPRKKTAAT